MAAGTKGVGPARRSPIGRLAEEATCGRRLAPKTDPFGPAAVPTAGRVRVGLNDIVATREAAPPPLAAPEPSKTASVGRRARPGAEKARRGPRPLRPPHAPRDAPATRTRVTTAAPTASRLAAALATALATALETTVAAAVMGPDAAEAPLADEAKRETARRGPSDLTDPLVGAEGLGMSPPTGRDIARRHATGEAVEAKVGRRPAMAGGRHTVLGAAPSALDAPRTRAPGLAPLKAWLGGPAVGPGPALMGAPLAAAPVALISGGPGAARSPPREFAAGLDQARRRGVGGARPHVTVRVVDASTVAGVGGRKPMARPLAPITAAAACGRGEGPGPA